MQQEQLDSIWPGWEITRKLGQGSYGGVYEIQRVLPGGRTERSAVKEISVPHNQEEVEVLLIQSVSEQSIYDHFRRKLEKLVQEYSMMRELGECANIVGCQDLRYIPNGYGWDIYIRMELLRPLKQIIEKQYREEKVLKLGLEMCNALKACSTRNIIHRDIKPENILVSDSGTYKLGDFGIAKMSDKTQAGTMIGTFGYMAPEVANRQQYGASADIYSLGMVLYWLMNEKTLPFLPIPPQLPTAAQRQQALNRRFSGEALPDPIHGSEELKKIVRKACAFSPENRYRTAEEMEADIVGLYRKKQDQLSAIFQELDLPASILEEDLRATPAEFGEPVVRTDIPPVVRGKHTGIWLGCGLIAAALIAGGVLFAPRLLKPLPEEAPAILEAEPARVPTETEEIPLAAAEFPIPEETALATEVLPATEETVPTVPEATEPMPEPNVVCTFTENATGVTITGSQGPLPAEAVFPDTLNGKPVTAIGQNAFASDTSVRKIVLPSSVTQIDDKAFAGCSRLQGVVISENLSQIGASAFEGCSSLSGIVFPASLEKIGSWAFANCGRLTAIDIPGTLSQLGEYSFSGCAGLREVQLHEGMTSLENYVFKGCQRLTEITIPEGVGTIGNGTFSDCTQLSEVVFPKSIRQLTANSFNNTALSTILIPKSCTLGTNAIPVGCAIKHME